MALTSDGVPPGSSGVAALERLSGGHQDCPALDKPLQHRTILAARPVEARFCVTASATCGTPLELRL